MTEVLPIPNYEEPDTRLLFRARMTKQQLCFTSVSMFSCFRSVSMFLQERYFLISWLILIWVTTIWEVKYLIFFPSYMLHVGHTNSVLKRSLFFKKFVKIPSFQPQSNEKKKKKKKRKMYGSNITMTEEIVQKTKISVQHIMYDGKLNEYYLSATVYI